MRAANGRCKVGPTRNRDGSRSFRAGVGDNRKSSPLRRRLRRQLRRGVCLAQHNAARLNLWPRLLASRSRSWGVNDHVDSQSKRKNRNFRERGLPSLLAPGSPEIGNDSHSQTANPFYMAPGGSRGGCSGPFDRLGASVCRTSLCTFT